MGILPSGFELTEVLPLIAVAIVVVWLILHFRRKPQRTIESVLGDIAFERLQNLVIPKADEGEILIDHLVLTAAGLLVVDIKEVEGNVFGSDKMDQWTVISEDKRFTFGNPQPALYDRIAAVRQIVRQVPVSGRVVFVDGARFTKGTPSMVASLDDLLADFREPDADAAKVKIEAFIPHWEQIKSSAEI